MELGIDKIWQLVGNQKESNKPTHAKAVVLRRDNEGTIWVKLEGGVDETPAYSTTADVRPNDIVSVKVTGGKVYIEGSTSSPSVGAMEFGDTISIVNKNVGKVDEKAENAAEDSKAALDTAKAAEEATEVARVTSQHFWVNDDEPETYGGAGAHVTEQDKDEWVEAIRRRFPDLSDDKPYHNILMNSLGILLRTALNNLVSITRSSIAFFDGLGNNTSNIVAYFGRDGAQIGSSESSHLMIDEDNVLGYGENRVAFLDIGMANTSETTFLENRIRRIQISAGRWSAEVDLQDAFSNEILDNDVIGFIFGDFASSFSAGRSDSYHASMAEGKIVYAISYDGENLITFDGTSQDITSSLELTLNLSRSIKTPSFMLGYGKANAPYSVSEGDNTTASGRCSHAQNLGTTAVGENQTAIGKYNAVDSDYAFIIGNGTSVNARSDAFVVDWDGAVVAGRSISLRSNHFTGLDNENFVGIYAQTKNRGAWAFRVFGSSSDEYGDAVVIGDGGLFIAGAGESAEALYNNALVGSEGTENAYLTADSEVHIVPNCNTIANRIDYLFNANGMNMRHKNIYDLSSIEMSPPANDSNHGGFIDFHYNQSTADYTSRIWENRSGGITVEGGASLRKVGNAWSNGIEVLCNYMTNNETVSTQSDSSYVALLDKNGTWMGRMFHRHGTDGTNWLYYETYRDVNGTNKWNHISVGIKSDGSLVYGVSDAAAFRSAIGAQASGTSLTLTGLTMNGAVTYHKVTNGINRDASDPSSAQWGNASVTWNDADNERIGYITNSRQTDNRIGLHIVAANENSAGNGEVTNQFILYVNRAGTATYYVSNAGNFRSAIGAAASSDRRLKSDIIPLSDEAIAFIDALEPCVYTINGERQVGLIAQDVHEADAWGTRMAFETVEGIDGLDDWEKMEDGSPTWKLDYIRIIPPLVATVKSQAKRIDEIESKVERLEKLVEKLSEK